MVHSSGPDTVSPEADSITDICKLNSFTHSIVKPVGASVRTILHITTSIPFKAHLGTLFPGSKGQWCLCLFCLTAAGKHVILCTVFKYSGDVCVILFHFTGYFITCKAVHLCRITYGAGIVLCITLKYFDGILIIYVIFPVYILLSVYVLLSIDICFVCEGLHTFRTYCDCEACCQIQHQAQHD